jgi:Fibronectin type III domain/Glycosyl hydrolase family 26
VSNNWGNSVIRLGWEFNGSWMPWAAGNDPVNYVAAYRHVVSLMRSVPGVSFTFDWCMSWGPNATAPDSVYPGDDVVDIIGMDVYNTYFSPANADPMARWNTLLTAPYGLNWLVTFSQAHGKPLSIPEWGTGEDLINNGGTGGGDDPLFVANMSNFMESNSAAYSDYWDSSASGYDATVSDGEHPLAGAALKAAFASVITPVLPPIIAPANAAVAVAIASPGPILWIGVGDAATTTSISINFSPPYGGGTPSSYTLLYRPSGTSAWATYGSVASVGTQTLSGMQPGTSYDVSVEAVNAAGSGPQSAVLSLSTLAGAGAGVALPGVIPWIGLGDVSTSNSISINFCPPNDGGTPTGYVIMIRVTGQSSWQEYGTVTWTGWQTVGGLSPGTSYDAQVYATNAAGSGQTSAVYTGSTL